MAATVSIRVFTGAGAATMSGAVAGMDMISADNAVNSLANRNAFPVPAGGQSFEKWLRARIDVAPANKVSNLRVWSDGVALPDATLLVGATDTGVTPTNAPSTVAVDPLTDFISTAKFDWDVANDLVDVGDLSDFLVLQLAIAADAEPGNIPTTAMSYSYDEQ